MDMNGRKYIAYGSNLNREQMAQRCPDAKVIESGMLKDYELLFRGYTDAAVATVEPKEGENVPVLIWANLSTYFKYPEAVRTLIYTTNAIEGFNRQLRKVTKNKSVFPTDDSLLKMLYLAMIDITKKWTGKRKDWGQIHSQLEIFFADRLSQ